MEERQFTVTPEAAGQRLDRFLSGLLPDMSRASLKKAVEQGHCHIDGLPAGGASCKVRAGQTVSLVLPSPARAMQPEDGMLDILWQDAHMAVINKPAGLTVHPCPSCPEGTLAHRLLAHFPGLAAQDGPRPGIVHRLDKDTSGLMVVALTEAARLRLSAAFAGREVHKEYLALMRGVPPQEGECSAPLGRHPRIKVKMAVVPERHGGRPARSAWRVLWSSPDGRAALAAVRIFTGRTHQIRVHCAYMGHPLWGDAVYGPADAADPAAARRALDDAGLPPAVPPARQMLHAWRLSLHHPMTGALLQFCCPPPQDMLDAAVTLGTCRMRRVVITGNPGCGKSSLLRRLGAAGLPVFSADAEVGRLYMRGGAGWDFLRQRHGSRFLREDGELNRPALRAAMHADPELRREVERYVHMLVRDALERFWHVQEQAGAACAVAEVPLYFEAGWHLEPGLPAPLTIAVSCPLDVRHARLLATRGWSAETSATLESWQWAAARKEAACDIRVDNSGSEADLDSRTAALLDELRGRRTAEAHALRRHLTGLWTPQAG